MGSSENGFIGRSSQDSYLAEDDEGFFKFVQPVVSSNSLDCVLCHTEIQDNVMTTFGSEEPFFFTGVYELFGSMEPRWRGLDIIPKNVYVPKVEMPSSYKGLVLEWEGIENRSLKEFLIELSSTSTPEKIVELDSIYLGAPSVEDILAEAPNLVDRSYRYFSNGVEESISGLVQSSGNDPSIRNTSAGSSLICDGDLVVNGVVFLDNVHIVSNKGCRIYATGPIMVNGTTTFDSNADTNLQLVSARAVFLNPTLEKLEHYFHSSAQPIHLRSKMITDNTEHHDLIEIFESIEGAESTSESVFYERLLLNAPIVMNFIRASEFKGAIISEMVRFSRSEKVMFDPVFERVPLIPLTGFSRSFRVNE